MQKFKLIKLHFTKILSVFLFLLLFGAYTNIFAIANKYNPGETLDPNCLPGEVNCTVLITSGSGSMIYPGSGIPTSTGTAWGASITNNSSNWNTAYGWGNHATAGYVTGTPWTTMGYVTGTPWTSMGYITDGNTGWDNSYGFITDGNTGWDNSYGFITSYTETDPIFGSSVAHGISSGDVSNWNAKQAPLVSGTNIKTINSTSLLGSGDIAVPVSPITIVNSSNLFSTGLTGTGSGVTGTTDSNFFGTNAGKSATGAYESNFLGSSAGYQATNAYDSNFLGKSAGSGATSARFSNFLGYSAGKDATEADSSNFLGPGAGNGATYAHSSNFIGYGAGYGGINASNSNFIGYTAGYNAINANRSNLLGYQVGMSFTNNNLGSNNIIIGTNISLVDATANAMNLGGVLFAKNTYSTTSGDPSITATATGSVGIGVTPANISARLHLPAGTTSASTAPLKFTSGTNMTNPEAGAMEWNGTNLFVTQTSGPTRKTLAYTTDIPSASPITVVNTSNLFSTGLTGTGSGVTTTTNSNFVGPSAGSFAVFASDSNFFGYLSGILAASASFSNFFGNNAGNSATSASNSNFLGQYAGYGASSAFSSNFLGANAGYVASSAFYSNFFGYGAGSNALYAHSSNFLGYQAGSSANNAAYSNLIGYNTGSTFTNNNIGSNNIIIGTNISLVDATANAMNLGGVLFAKNTYTTTSGDPSITATATGSVGIGVTPANISARLMLPAGTTSAETAPIKFTSGTLLGTPESGALEYDSSHLYFTDGGGSRYQLDQQTGGVGDSLWYSNSPQESIYSTNRVSIGTSSPSDNNSLNVEGGALLSGSTEIPFSSFTTRGTTSDNISDPHSVAVHGNYAYVANYNNNNGSGSLSVYNISNPDLIAFVDSSTSNLYSPWSVALSSNGNYAFVADRSGKIVSFDTSNILDSLGTVSMGLINPNSLFISGNYAYVTDPSNHSLNIFNVSNPSSMTLAGSTTDLSYPRDVVVYGNYAYVADSNNGLVIFNISNPSDIINVGSTTANLNRALKLSVSGQYAYVTNGTDGGGGYIFAVFDITDPTNIIALGTDTTLYSQYGGVAINGNYAYVGTQGALYMFDINDKNNISQPDSVSNENLACTTKIIYVNNYVYATDGCSNTLNIFQVGANTGARAPLKFTSGNLLNNTQGGAVEYDGSHLYFTATDGGSRYQLDQQTGGVGDSLWTASNPNIYFNSGNVGIGTSSPTAKLNVVGGALFSGGGTGGPGNSTLTVRGTTTSNITNSTTYNWDPRGVATYGNYTYIIDQGTGENNDGYLAYYNTSNPDSISFIDSTTTNLSYPTSLAVSSTGDIFVTDSGNHSLSSYSSSLTTLGVASDLTSPNSVAISGNYAYVTDMNSWSNNGYMVVYNISDPSNITYVTDISTGLSKPWSISISGNYAYVADWGTQNSDQNSDGYIAIYDISDPANISYVTNFSTASTISPQEILASGNYVYVYDYPSGTFSIFDVTDKNNVVTKDTYTTVAYSSYSMSKYGNYVYLTSYGISLTNAIYALDVSDPDNIVLVDTVAPDGNNIYQGESIFAGANEVYVMGTDGDGLQHLSIFDALTPASTGGNTLDVSGGMAIGSYATTNIAPTNGLIVSGNVGIGTSSPTAKLHVVGGALFSGGSGGGIPNTTLNTRGTTSENVLDPTSVAVYGNYAYVVDPQTRVGYGTISKFDISNPDSISFVSANSTTLQSPMSIALSSNGSYAFVVDSGTSTLNSYNTSDLTSTVGSTDANLSSPQYIAVSGNYAYVADNNNGLVIFNISDPANITYVSTTSSYELTFPSSVAVSGNYAYVTYDYGYTTGALAIYDISDPENVSFVGSIGDNINTPYRVAVSGNYAYVTNTSGLDSVFAVFDVTDKVNIVAKGTATTPYGQYGGVVVNGNYAYVGDNTDSLYAFDISDPDNIVQVDTVNNANTTCLSSLFYANNSVYATDYCNYGSLNIFDALGAGSTNTAPPIKIGAGSLLSTTQAGAIEYDGSHLYFTAANAGVRYQLDQQSGVSSSSQWITTKSDIYYNTGYVGIGTNRPKSLLDISIDGSSSYEQTFSGSGLDDATYSGTYSGSTPPNYIYVTIDSTGAPDTFSYHDDNGDCPGGEGVAITGSTQTLCDGISITFASTAEHTLSDEWTYTITPTTSDNPIFRIKDNTGNNYFSINAVAPNSSFVGIGAGENATNAPYSNFFGNSAGSDATNASYSNFFGKNAGYQATNASYSNLFGFKAGASFTANNIGSNNIIIGTNISLPDSTANAMNLGGVLFATGTQSDVSAANPYITAVSGGKVGIGVVTPSYTLQVGNSGVSGVVARFQNSTGTCDINPTTSSIGCSSDIRLKKNITTLDGILFELKTIDQANSTSVIDKIMELTPVTFNWNVENDTDPKHIGFIAQEMEQVFPDLVSTDPVTGLKSLSYANMTPYLTKAIQEMKLKVDNLASLDLKNENSLASLIKKYLSDAQNGLEIVFFGEVRTKKLCLDDLCIDKPHLEEILKSTNSDAGSTGGNNGSGTTDSSTGNTPGSGTSGSTPPATTDTTQSNPSNTETSNTTETTPTPPDNNTSDTSTSTGTTTKGGEQSVISTDETTGSTN